MDKKELQLIQELMEQLQAEMSPTTDDFNERLGRNKPEPGMQEKPAIEVTKIEGAIPLEEEEEDMEMSDMMEYDESPEDKLKNRLMKLRG